LCSIGFGQDQFRLQFAMSVHSTMYGGTRSFEKVSRSDFKDMSYYEYEEYSIDYSNFAFSGGLNLRFSLNWLNNEKNVIRQSISGFTDFYEEKINYKLTDFMVGDTNSYPNGLYQNDFDLGDENLALMNGVGVGLTNEIIYLRKLESNWNIGGGIAFNIIRRNDWSYKWSYELYGPNHTRLTYGQYTTKQLGIILHIEKSFNRWNFFMNFNQAILTTKKEANKGGEYYPEQDRIHPISHNLDYRFPLLINFGTAVQFGKVKK
jgi:hypothetical protein